jgi:hypothetical protein
VSIFTGGRKDTQEISSWSHKDGGVPDKDDITNAYAASYNVNNELIIYFGADRFANSGDAQLGFWFFQDEVTAEPDGSFHGDHTLGDLLVLVNFETGGTTPSIDVLEWVGTGGDQQGGTLQLLTVAGSECGNTTEDVCAITNSEPAPSPWAYTPKGGLLNDDFPSQSFFEGGINISALFTNETAPCFASFMAETRSSTSVAASLKDFTLGAFPLCGLSISNLCTSGDIQAGESGFTYEFSGTVQNTGFGTLYDVVVTEEGQEFALGDLGPGASVDYSGSFDSDMNPPSTGASVSASTSDNAAPTLSDSTGPVDCPVVDRDPAISVSKDCDIELEVVGDLVVLVANYEGQVCNDTSGDSAVGLVNVSVVDDGGTPNDDSDDQTFDIGDLPAGECASYGPGSYRPSSTNSTNPLEAMFGDTVTATGDAALGFGSVEETASASCPLCPEPTP